MSTPRARAFAMVEVVMATAIVGGIAVAALSLVGSVAKQKTDAAILARGQALARSLAEEIAAKPVTDWSDGTGLRMQLDSVMGIYILTGSDVVFKSITGKSGNRNLYTKIDDYKGYTESPPRDDSGVVLSGYTGWTRTVQVKLVDINMPGMSTIFETGLRCVEVTASYNGKPIATTTFLRSSEWERVMP